MKKKWKPKGCYDCGGTEFTYRSLKGMRLYAKTGQKILNKDIYAWVCNHCSDYGLTGRDCSILDELLAHSPDALDKDGEWPGYYWDKFNKGFK